MAKRVEAVGAKALLSYPVAMPLQSDKLRLLRRIPDIRFEEETRGYSKDQVDRVLANLAPLADEIERLQSRLAESESRAASAEARLVEARTPSQAAAAPGMPPAPQPDFDETLRNTLVSAQRQADTTVREAKEESERLRTEAEFQTNALLADARDQAAEMTTEAVAYRDKLMAEAARERANLLEDARSEAETMVGAVEKELAEAHEAERTDLVNQISDLQGKHQMLQTDVTRFEDHLSSRSSDVRKALEEIMSALDDPEQLRANDELKPADLDEFSATDYPPIAVEVVALNELEAEAKVATDSTAHTGDIINAADLDELDEEGLEYEDEEDVVYEDEVYEETTEPAEGFSNDDPQIGVQTQIVPPPSYDDGAAGNGEVHAAGNGVDDESDRYMDELHRVTNEDLEHGDPISDFLDNKQDRGGGWFGRRK